jgi:PIN domain
LSSFGVVLDACVLIPATLRDTLLRAAEKGMYRLHWSDEILDEVRRNLVKRAMTSPENAQDLNKKEQISLTYYAEHMIDDIRDNPAKYMINPTTAPMYASTLNNLRCINDGFWQIIIGKIIDKETMGLMDDSIVVQGDALWEFNEEKYGIQASVFHQQH